MDEETGMNRGRTNNWAARLDEESLADAVGIGMRRWQELVAEDMRKYPRLYAGSLEEQLRQLSRA